MIKMSPENILRSTLGHGPLYGRGSSSPSPFKVGVIKWPKLFEPKPFGSGAAWDTSLLPA